MNTHLGVLLCSLVDVEAQPEAYEGIVIPFRIRKEDVVSEFTAISNVDPKALKANPELQAMLF
ncbi:hypothetical protein D3C75_1264850 [compost metagenome]